MRIPVDTPDDPRLNAYRDLPAAKRSRTSRLFIAESELVVRRLLESEFEVESVLAMPSAAERLSKLIPAAVPFFVATKSVVSEVAGYRFHSGVLACGVRRPPQSVREVIARRSESEQSLVVALSEVVDVDNVGSIVRSAAAFAATAVLLDRRCADAFSRRGIRVSVGNVFKIPVLECDNLAAQLVELRDAAGYSLHAAVTDSSAAPLAEIEPSGRDALVFGGEGYGLAPELQALCGSRVTVPTAEAVDSLNVSVASAIVMNHFAVTSTER